MFILLGKNVYFVRTENLIARFAYWWEHYDKEVSTYLLTFYHFEKCKFISLKKKKVSVEQNFLLILFSYELIMNYVKIQLARS